MLNFEEYLRQKKINGEAFRKKDPERWQEFITLFDRVHPESFTAQKLFLINRIRRKFPLAEASAEKQAVPQKIRPKLRPRPKGGPPDTSGHSAG